MSKRLATKVGLIPNAERGTDAKDLVRVNEPTVGAPVRTKGSLYLVAQLTNPGSNTVRAARQALESIEHDYYYDLSAGPLDTLARAWPRRTGACSMPAAGPGSTGAPRSASSPPPSAPVSSTSPRSVRRARSSSAATAFELPPPHAAEDDPDSPRRVADSLGEVLEIDPVTWSGELGHGDRLALVSRNLAEVVGAEDTRQTLLKLRPGPAARAPSRSSSEGAAARTGCSRSSSTPSRSPPPRIGSSPSARPTRWPGCRIAALSPAPTPSAGRRAGRTARGSRPVPGRRLARPVDRAALLVHAPPSRGLSAAGGPHRGHRGSPPPESRRAGHAGPGRTARRRGDRGQLSIGRSHPGHPPAVAREAIAEGEGLIAEVEDRIDGLDLVERDPERAKELLAAAERAPDRAEGPVRPRLWSRSGSASTDALYAVARIRELTTVVDLDAAFNGVEPERMVAASDGSLWVLETGRGRVIRGSVSGTAEAVYRAGQQLDGGVAATRGSSPRRPPTWWSSTATARRGGPTSWSG